jgi:copper transport protein
MRGAFTVALGAVVGVVLWTATASAHAGLESSDPRAGELLPAAPDAITLAFTEPPDPELTQVTVVDAVGAPVEVGGVQRGSAARSIRVALPDDLPDGIYTVSWRVVSTADGHQTAGVFAFGVGTTGAIEPVTDAPASSTPPPSPLAVIGKVLLYAGLAVAVGAAVTSVLAFGGVVAGRRVLLPAAGTFALLGATAMTLAEARLLDVSLGDLLTSATGRSYVWLVATSLATLVAAIVAGRTAGRVPVIVMGAAAAAAMLVRAMSGHAAAVIPPQPSEVAQWAHFLAIGVWIGGLVALAALLVRDRRDATPPPVEQVRAFSGLAGWAVLVVVVTGVFRSVTEAGGFGEVAAMLTDTTYGTTLIVKVALALVLVGLGALNRRRSIPRLADDGRLLSKVVGVELVAAVGVFALTGTLTSLNPDPPADERPSAPASVSATGTDFATTMRVTFTATPGTAGPNRFDVRVEDFDDATPLPVDEVTATMAPIGRPEIEEATLELEPSDPAEGAPATWSAPGTQLSIAGAWDVTVQVRSGAETTEVPLVLVTRTPPTTSVVAEGTGDLPAIETVTMSTGEQLQLYLDPGVAGANEYHITAFDPGGDELPLSGLIVVATAPDGSHAVLDATRLTAGHFAAPLDAAGGAWTFDVVATSEGGTVLQATQRLEVAP